MNHQAPFLDSRKVSIANPIMLKLALLGIASVSAATTLRGHESALTHQHKASLALHTTLHEEPTEEESGYGDEATASDTINKLDDQSTPDDDDEESGYGDDDATGGDESNQATGKVDHDKAISDDSTQFEFKFAKKGEKHWHVPAMKEIGYFKGQAGMTKDGINKTLLENTFAPTMIPTDGFAIRAATPLEKVNDTKLSPFVPKTVTHGELVKMRLSEDVAENSEVEGELKKKEAALSQQQTQGACALMDAALLMARAARAEEEAAKGEGQALVDIVKTICPALKYQYSFIMRCKKCATMSERLAKFYEPGFDTKVFPGLEHPNKCDTEKWPTKNFGTSFCSGGGGWLLLLFGWCTVFCMLLLLLCVCIPVPSVVSPLNFFFLIVGGVCPWWLQLLKQH